MFIGLLFFITALFIGYKCGEQVGKDEERRKNSNYEPRIFTLEHDAWEKTQKCWHDFIKSLESKDTELIRRARDDLNHQINEAFNNKVSQLKRIGIYIKNNNKT